MRRGLKTIEEAKAIDLEVYMAHVEDFYKKYFIKNPGKLGTIKKNVYLVTEDVGVLDEALRKYLNLILISQFIYSHLKFFF